MRTSFLHRLSEKHTNELHWMRHALRVSQSNTCGSGGSQRSPICKAGVGDCGALSKLSRSSSHDKGCGDGDGDEFWGICPRSSNH